MCVCVSPRGGPLRLGASPRSTQRGAMLRCAALAVLCAALVHADRARRAEMSPVPFVMGSRYGRSPERVMAPRNDRFFMGSRYGKRSEVMEEGRGEMPGVVEGCEEGDDTPPARCRRLVCRYTGVHHLYKCGHDLQFASRNIAHSKPGDSNE